MFYCFVFQKMTSWMTHGGSFDEADEDEAASEVAEQIKAVDLELQQLQFEMAMNAKEADKKAAEAEKKAAAAATNSRR